MKDQEFKKLFDESVKREEDLLLTKGKEYRCGDEDVLANFKRLAQKMDIPIEKVWAIYFTKHIDSIINFVKSGKTFSDEGIQGRIDDARNYLMLGRAIFEEKYQLSDPQPTRKNPFDGLPATTLPWTTRSHWPIADRIGDTGALPPGTIVREPPPPFKAPFLYEGLRNQIRDQKLDDEIKDLTDKENDNFLKGFKKDG